MTPERYTEIFAMFHAYMERHGRLTAYFVLMDVDYDGKVDTGDEECQEDVTRIIQETGLTAPEIHDWAWMYQEELDRQVEDDMEDYGLFDLRRMGL